MYDLFGLQVPPQYAILVAILVLVFNIAGRAIPDSATGLLGFVRKVCKVLGLYLANRVRPGVSNNDGTRIAIDAISVAETAHQRIDTRKEEIKELANSLTGKTVLERDATGRFLPPDKRS